MYHILNVDLSQGKQIRDNRILLVAINRMPLKYHWYIASGDAQLITCSTCEKQQMLADARFRLLNDTNNNDD